MKKAVPDQSVLFDEVMGGSLQRAFALGVFLFSQCSSVGGGRNELEAAGSGKIDARKENVCKLRSPSLRST